ncbi:MAG TPA: exo-alpha-sialidase [Bryobacteraceae bacterium]|nr:exo-alpha-sialidase [Bryobacteraceae bacterium]
MLFLALLFALRLTPDAPGAPLKQPQLAVDGKTVALTYGVGNSVFFSRSDTAGRSFSAPVRVGDGVYLALGNHRGPRVAMVGDAVVVTAITGAVRGKDGDVVSWRSVDGGRTWSAPTPVSGVPAAAREGLHGMAAGPGGRVWVVWLDLRDGAMRLYGALSKDAGKTWEQDREIYASPDGHICECCHPTPAIGAKGELYVMWRNWLGGSRDMYRAVSQDGKVWDVKKLGQGTWPLNACPMDGGGLGLDRQDRLHSAWRRDGVIYRTTSDGKEVAIGKGKNAALAMAASGPVVAWQDGPSILVQAPGAKGPVVVGTGAFPVLAASGDVVFGAWESDGAISVERVR